MVAPVLAGCGLTYEIQDYTPTGQTVLLGSGVRILLTVFCGGFAAVVLLTSAANILSTVSSSMLQRRRELSLLLSAGMSAASWPVCWPGSVWAMACGAFCGAFRRDCFWPGW